MLIRLKERRRCRERTVTSERTCREPHLLYILVHAYFQQLRNQLQKLLPKGISLLLLLKAQPDLGPSSMNHLECKWLSFTRCKRLQHTEQSDIAQRTMHQHERAFRTAQQ